MKNYIKNTWYMYVIAFVFCFMLFLYEPIMMFLVQQDEFAFGFDMMLKSSFLLFFMSFIFLMVILNLVYFFIKKKKFNYKNLTVVMFIVFFCSYIQGNYLAGNLPVLVGAKINWNEYTIDSIISAILWVIVIGIVIVLCKKIKKEKLLNYFGYAGIVIFIMISTSLFITGIQAGKINNSNVIIKATNKNLNEYSSNKNFIIFLLDTVNSKDFYSVVNDNKEFKNLFNDFTYYPDTLSGHPFTGESLPLILTGEFYENKEPIREFSTKAYKESYLFKTLEDKGYDLNLYSPSIRYDDTDALKISNCVDAYEMKSFGTVVSLAKQEIKYSLFKYLPYFLKKYSSIDTLGWDIHPEGLDLYDWSNVTFNNYLNNGVKISDKNNFKFIHLEGAHEPFHLNKDLKESEGSYRSMVEASVTLTSNYINYLKENKLYDNSVIVIIADHGYNLVHNYGRQNPVLLVKGINEHHGGMTTSNKPISFVDLKDGFLDLINGKKSTQLFANISNNRVRRHMVDDFGTNKPMVEYETKDKAWETDKLYKTGRVFDRK